jgi:hypothetical protein
VKYVLPTVWVQFTGLPLSPTGLPDHVGVDSILGFTKDADMRFDMTRIDVC